MTLQLGTVRPGSTIYIPFGTYDKDDGSSITMTGLAATDIEIYKDGSTTQRGSDTGYTLLDTDGIDFDSVTGQHGFSIDLSSNATAGFYSAGSRYFVWVASITVDAVTVNFLAAVFDIGYPDAILNTTIASLSTQTSFTLTSGPAEDDALNGSVVCIHDVASAVQLGYAVILDYTGSTKTVTLAAGTTFTAAATDNIAIFPPAGVNYWAGTGVPASDTAGYPKVTIKDGTGTGEIDTTSGGVLVAAIAANAITAGAIAADAIGASELAADAASEIGTAVWATAARVLTANTNLNDPSAATIAAAVWDLDATGHQTGGTFGQAIGDPGASTETLFKAIVTDPAGTNIAADVIAIKAETAAILDDTDDIGIAGAGLTEAGGTGDHLTAVPWNAAWDAEVQSEVTDGLNAYDPPTRAELTSDVNSIIAYLDGLVIAKGTIGSTGNSTTALHLTGLTYGDNEINNYLIAIKDISTGEWHARYIENWADTGDIATVATLPFTPENAVDTYAILAFRQDVTGGAGLDAAGVRAAVGLASANLDTQLGTIDTNVDSILDDTGTAGVVVASLATGAITAGAIAADAIGASELAADAVTEIANAVWDMDATGHQTQGTFGQAIGDPVADTGTIFKATVTDATGVTVGSDTATLLTRMGIPSDLGGGATMAANLSDIEGQTDDIGAAGAGLTVLATAAELAKVPKSDSTVSWNATALASINTQADLALSDYDAPTHAEMTAELATADDAVLAAIAALNNLSSSAAATAVLTTAMTESYAADGVAPTLAQAIYLIQQRLTEFAISTTTITVKKLDGTTTAATLTLDDATSPTSSARAS